MNTTLTEGKTALSHDEQPGGVLGHLRETKGYSQEYVAGKLHLRVKVIEQLEMDAYDLLPEPVFIKGYLRAYANLLEVPYEPLLETFNHHYVPSDKKTDKVPLWQSRRQTHRGENLLRWMTLFFGLIVLVSVGLWWQKNKDAQQEITNNLSDASVSSRTETEIKSENEVKLEQPLVKQSDISTMQSIITSSSTIPAMETAGG
jgi:cytoskeleton protein RodZ